MKTVIYTQRVEVIEVYRERRDCADQRIADFISACGFLPIPVPNRSDLAEGIIKDMQPAGIILTGGNSLVRYGGNAPERDAMDSALIDLAIQDHIPLYGFCRGMQSILAYFGNDLVNVDGHVAVRHTVISEEGSYGVNSYHNQACVKLKDGCRLLATAKTEDGVIEAIRHENLPIMGTMWHPEREEIFTGRDIENVRNIMRV